MNEYDAKIEKLTEEITTLRIAYLSKERELKTLLKKKEDNRDRGTKDHYGNDISIGDRVRVVTKGKFRNTEGVVAKIGKWVTFSDDSGVKQVRSPSNLVITRNVVKRRHERGNPGATRK